MERDFCVKRAQDIIKELSNSLNMEAGTIAENFRQLYQFMNSRLSAAVLDNKNFTFYVKDVAVMVKSLRDAWSEALKQAKKV
jgi:flagellar biosynthetic protein FliS